MRRGSRFDALAGLAALPWLLGFALPAPAQYGFGDCEREEVWRAKLDEWTANGFRIGGAGSGLGGLGYAFGWDDTEIWIATPAHVVYGDIAADASLAEVLALREEASARLLVRPLASDEVLPLCDGEESVQGYGPMQPGKELIDLAFVCIQRPAGLYLQRELIAEVVRPDDEYRMLTAASRPRAGALAGRLVAPSDGDGRYLELESAIEVQPVGGMSGAMVVTPAGLAGLYLGWQERGRALRMDALRREVAGAKLPWNLTASEHFDCTAQREVCFVVEPPLNPDELLVESRGRSVTVVVAGDRSCASLQEGRYSLKAGGRRLHCEPIGFRVVGGQGPLTTGVTCRPDFSGNWSAGPLGELYCTHGLFGDGSCLGLAALGRGLFSGSLGWNGDHAVLRGRFQSAYPVSGEATLEWTGGNLSGKLELQGADSKPIPIVLRPLP